MSSGERPIGAAKGKQSDTCAKPPRPPLQELCSCQNCGMLPDVNYIWYVHNESHRSNQTETCRY